MKLEWMGEYRDMVAALIHYCNIYAAVHKTEFMEYDGVRYSYSQIQVIEYLLENEDRGENMSAIASRLGISRSNFTKIVNRLTAKGLIEKTLMDGSKKEIALTVTDVGRKLYNSYVDQIKTTHFLPMFASLEGLSQKDLAKVTKALNSSLDQSQYRQNYIDV